MFVSRSGHSRFDILGLKRQKHAGFSDAALLFPSPAVGTAGYPSIEQRVSRLGDQLGLLVAKSSRPSTQRACLRLKTDINIYDCVVGRAS